MLGDQEVLIMRNLGAPSSFDEATRASVLQLVARGYLERDGNLFKLTAMGLQQLLDRRSPS